MTLICKGESGADGGRIVWIRKAMRGPKLSCDKCFTSPLRKFCGRGYHDAFYALTGFKVKGFGIL